jgi:hypothetical protein
MRLLDEWQKRKELKLNNQSERTNSEGYFRVALFRLLYHKLESWYNFSKIWQYDFLTMDNDDLRELIELRIGSLERMFGRELTYMTEAMERVADQSAPVSTVQSLLLRVDKLEIAIKDKSKQLDQILFKIRIMWWVGAIITGTLIAIATELIKTWAGL